MGLSCLCVFKGPFSEVLRSVAGGCLGDWGFGQQHNTKPSLLVTSNQGIPKPRNSENPTQTLPKNPRNLKTPNPETLKP